MMDQDDPDKRLTNRERWHAEVSERGDEAGKRVSANGLGLGLVLIGAVAMAIAMFLPFAQPIDGLPILGKNTVFELIGWHVLWQLFFIPYFGYLASQGKRFARWSLIGFCVLAAAGVVALATDNELRTMRVMGPGGASDSTGPGFVDGLGIAIYVAAAGVAVAIVGALALFQNARKESQDGGSTVQRTGGARQTRDLAGSERHSHPEEAVLEAGRSAADADVQAVEALAPASGTRWQSKWPPAAAVAVVAVAVASYLLLGRPVTASQSSAASQPPTSLTPAQTALQGLLLSADQISTAMGTTELTVKETTGAMNDVAKAVSDKACEPIAFPAEAQVYEGSGWTSTLGQLIQEPGRTFRHAVNQAVVSFPSAKEAGAFFTASAQRWPACANRQFTVEMMGTNMGHTAGPVSNTNGTLSVTQNQDGADPTYSCQRALTVANNIVIDVATCSLERSGARSYAAINIAYQIAAKASVGNHNAAPSSTPETNTPGLITAPPVAESALEGLLLSPDPINTAMGTTGLTVNHNTVKMTEPSAEVSDQACLPLTGVLMAPAYAGSGWNAFREQVLREPGDINPQSVDQGVVLFSSAQDARAFFTSSAQRWQACSNRQYTETRAGKPDAVYTVGPVSNTNGTLSYTKTQNPYSVGNKEYGGIVQRVLTWANNVVVDVEVGSMSQSDSASDAAANIAHQIAALVPTT
jgi:hypothetical protein